MKIIYKEYNQRDYNSYRFPYCVYAIRESGDSYEDLYSRGFLPYSNDLESTDEIYYLARSVRIDLLRHTHKFKQNNIFNKFAKVYDPGTLSVERIPKMALMHNPEFHEWCITHARNHFLTTERLSYILDRPYLKEVLKISSGEKLLAYLLIVTEQKHFLHVWFSFYDTSVNLNDFGKWILLQTVQWSKAEGYRTFYIGTCYPPTGFYKLTLSSFTEYFSGESWNDDISRLKSEMS